MPTYLQTASFFRAQRDLQSGRINDFGAVCKCSRPCVNFHGGTFRVYMRLLAEFECPVREAIKADLKPFLLGGIFFYLKTS